MIAIRSLAQRPRHRTAVAVLLVVVSLLVVWEHAGEPEPHMDHVGSICMAVVSGLSVVATVAGVRWSLPRPLPRAVPRPRPLTNLFDGPAPLPAARAGPTRLQVLRR